MFDDAVAVFGAMLMIGALLAGLARRTFLSLTAVFVVTGLLLGPDGLEVLDLDADSGFVESLAVVALIVILFRDGLEVEEEMLQDEWRLPFRKLVLAMPITAGIVACITKLVTELDWTESFLVGALLAPTDPVLTSSVVTNPRVPRVIRHSLNLESGMNDGLALPAVVALSAALAAGQDDFVWWEFVLQDVSIGLVTGLVVGFAAAAILPTGGDELERESVTPHQKALFALGVAFAAYGAAVLPPHGNGLIATFVAAIALGIRRPDVRLSFETRSEDVIEAIKLGVFLVFGALLTFDALTDLDALVIAAATLLLARPVAVFAALVRTRTDTAERAFMSWFGPKGVATMTFAIFVLGQDLEHGPQIFQIAAVAVFVSIIAHGLTDTPGANWMARRSTVPADGHLGPEDAPRPAAPAADPADRR